MCSTMASTHTLSLPIAILCGGIGVIIILGAGVRLGITIVGIRRAIGMQAIGELLIGITIITIITRIMHGEVSAAIGVAVMDGMAQRLIVPASMQDDM